MEAISRLVSLEAGLLHKDPSSWQWYSSMGDRALTGDAAQSVAPQFRAWPCYLIFVRVATPQMQRRPTVKRSVSEQESSNWTVQLIPAKVTATSTRKGTLKNAMAQLSDAMWVQGF